MLGKSLQQTRGCWVAGLLVFLGPAGQGPASTLASGAPRLLPMSPGVRRGSPFPLLRLWKHSLAQNLPHVRSTPAISPFYRWENEGFSGFMVEPQGPSRSLVVAKVALAPNISPLFRPDPRLVKDAVLPSQTLMKRVSELESHLQIVSSESPVSRENEAQKRPGWPQATQPPLRDRLPDNQVP